MKKPLFLSFLLLLPAAPVSAAPAVSPLTRVLLSRPFSAPGGSRAAESPRFIPAIIRLDEAEAPVPSFLHLLSRRGDLALVNVPAERISEVMSAPGILRMEAGICALPTMDEARKFCGLAESQAGAPPLPRSFDGSGVVCGFADTGFDPAHVNFADQATGKTRVRLLANYDPFIPQPETASSEAAIAAWETDDSGNWHATHVAGILAGSYNGSDAPYMGVAPAADIIATTSTLDAPYLLAGCDLITGYAREHGKPAVINMSISSFTGPRDGSTLFNQYLARIAEEAAVCVSAGNDGDRYSGYFRFTPSESRPAVETRAIGSDWDCIDVAGVADLWSLDSRPFDIRPVVWDDLEKRICLELPALDPEKGVDYLEFTPENTPALAALGKFDTRIVLTCELNPENNRFNAAMGIDYTNNSGEHYPSPYDPAKSRYHVGFRVSSPAGATVDCHVSSALMMMSCGEATAPAFSNQLTINDLCCGEGIIAVGAMCTRSTVPVLGSETPKVATPYTPGSPASFTSFGDTPLGTLPHISAPGAPVISSVSGPYITANELPDDQFCAKTEADGRPHYWGEASGTSMSSPYAAGVLALWLQADPTLTPAELKQIALETAASPVPSASSSPSSSPVGCARRNTGEIPSDPRWGAGIIDALSGLRRILGISSLSSVTAEPPAAEFRLEGSTLLCVPLRSTLVSLSAYTPDGRLLVREAEAGQGSNHASYLSGSASFSERSSSRQGSYQNVSITLPSNPPVIIAVAILADGSRHSARLLSPPR